MRYSQLYILLLILFALKTAHADSTLVFSNPQGEEEKSLLTYHVKNGQLRLIDGNSERINIYTKAKQTFSTTDIQNNTTSNIDAQLLDKQVEIMTKQRMAKLALVEQEFEKKTARMKVEEIEIAQSLINQLKYPEFYGAHTLLKISKTNQSKTIANIDCVVYELYRANMLLKKVCIANNKSLKLSADDYDTLINFYRFNYTTQTRLLIASGKTDFMHVDYQQENIDGIPIEVTIMTKQGDRLESIIQKVSTDKLSDTLFSIQKH